jgi:hypothetical protein
MGEGGGGGLGVIYLTAWSMQRHTDSHDRRRATGRNRGGAATAFEAPGRKDAAKYSLNPREREE